MRTQQRQRVQQERGRQRFRSQQPQNRSNSDGGKARGRGKGKEQKPRASRTGTHRMQGGTLQRSTIIFGKILNLAMSRTAMLTGLWGVSGGLGACEWSGDARGDPREVTGTHPDPQEFDSKGAVDVSFGQGVGTPGGVRGRVWPVAGYGWRARQDREETGGKTHRRRHSQWGVGLSTAPGALARVGTRTVPGTGARAHTIPGISTGTLHLGSASGPERSWMPGPGHVQSGGLEPGR